MAKQKYIKLELEHKACVLGLASHERIWKLCWDLNQCLELELAAPQPDALDAGGPEVYADADSHPDFEFLLFEHQLRGNKAPAIAREFRFWLVIKPKREREPLAHTFLEALRGLESISLAQDLSGVKDINKLLP